MGSASASAPANHNGCELNVRHEHAHNDGTQDFVVCISTSNTRGSTGKGVDCSRDSLGKTDAAGMATARYDCINIVR